MAYLGQYNNQSRNAGGNGLLDGSCGAHSRSDSSGFDLGMSLKKCAIVFDIDIAVDRPIYIYGLWSHSRDMLLSSGSPVYRGRRPSDDLSINHSRLLDEWTTVVIVVSRTSEHRSLSERDRCCDQRYG